MAKATTTSTGRSAKAKSKPAPVVRAKPMATPAKKESAPAGKKTAGGKPSVKAASTQKVAPTAPAVSKKAPVSASLVKKQAAPVKLAAKTAAPSKAIPKTTAGKAKTPAKAPTSRVAAAASSSKTVAVKTAAPRRPKVRTAVPIPTARRGRQAPVPHKPAAPSASTTVAAAKAPAPSATLAAVPPQIFTVSHLNEADFKPDGLRPYAQYRDLGIAAATGALCQAHVIRFIPPCTDEVRKRHVHQADLQLVYVLKGWMKNEFEGHGEQMMSAGSCWLQPSGIKHTVLDYSADCEVLEIIVPADFKTEELT